MNMVQGKKDVAKMGAGSMLTYILSGGASRNYMLLFLLEGSGINLRNLFHMMVETFHV